VIFFMGKNFIYNLRIDSWLVNHELVSDMNRSLNHQN